MFLGVDQAPAHDIVHGYTNHGDCTLIGFQEIETPGLLDFGSGRGVRWHKFGVTGACLTGWHLPSDTTDVLTAADLTYTAINEWLPGCGVATTFTEDAVTISFPKKRPTFLDVCVLSNRVRVVIKIDPNFQFRFGGKGHSSLSEPIIMLEPEQPKSLQWFVDAIHRFENFLSLCLGSSVRAKTVRLIGQSEENESDGSYDLAVEEPRNRMCRSGFAAIAFNSRPRLHHGSRLQRNSLHSKISSTERFGTVPCTWRPSSFLSRRLLNHFTA